jgi:mannan endo-1,4-beta-mannosidase
MKLSVKVIAKVLACLSLFVGLTQPVAAARGNVLLGVYYGNQGWNTTQLQDMETWQGKKHAVVNLFTNWCADQNQINNLFTQQLPNLWDNQNVPMITWEPKLGDPYLYNLCQAATTPEDIEVQAITHTYDNYFTSWATGLKDFLKGDDGSYNTSDDRRVYLRLAHEMNGDWYPWSAELGTSTPADYVAMWRYIKDFFDRKGLDANHVQWVWAVNNTDSDHVNFPAEQYYPGHNYVHWVAIDGYNFGDSTPGQDPTSSWKTPTQVFNPVLDPLAMVTRLRTLTNNNKPLAITEVGSTTQKRDSYGVVSTDVVAKGQWITDFFTKVVNNCNVKMVVWFDEDKSRDWTVFGGENGDGTFLLPSTNTLTNTYSTYQTAVALSNFVSSNGTDRLLTDAQFAGQ